MVYTWKTYNYKTDANVAGKVCEELNQGEGLTPQNLVNVSRPEDAPLHNEFEWDDSVAAEEYRKTQARGIISSLSIVIENQPVTPVRAFYSLQNGFRKNSNVYESTVTIIRDDQKRKTLLEKAYNELENFRNKYKMLNELREVFDAIEDVVFGHGFDE